MTLWDALARIRDLQAVVTKLRVAERTQRRRAELWRQRALRQRR